MLIANHKKIPELVKIAKNHLHGSAPGQGNRALKRKLINDAIVPQVQR